MPPRGTLPHYTPEILEWVGRATAAVEAWAALTHQSAAVAAWHRALDKLHGGISIGGPNPDMAIPRVLYQAQSQLRLTTVGPVNVAVGTGKTFDYFDQLRKIIEEASTDILFVDPYMNADFASRYLQHVKNGVTIRLLVSSDPKNERYVSSLKTAVEMFAQQYRATIAVRSAKELHDRWVFIDNRRCFQSGASFKDGGAKTGTTITENVDAFAVLNGLYEGLWQAST